MQTRRMLVLSVSALAAWAVPAGVALAGKPGGGGGGTGGGTIYFAVQGTGTWSVWSMASDGSGKTQLPVAAVYGRLQAPSHQLHGERRWFVVRQDVGGTDPDGRPHAELFAVRDDGGASAQLTADPDVAVTTSSWAKDDSFLSYAAVDFSVPGAPTSELLRVGLSFDGAGTPAPAGAPVSIVELPGVLGTVGSGQYVSPLIAGHDWAPTGGQVVWQDISSGGFELAGWTLHLTTVGGGTTTLATGGDSPQWSNDGVSIVFESTSGIDTISASGANRTTIVKRGAGSPSVYFELPEWSPTGTHVAYERIDKTLFGPRDVWRATSSGASKTELTGDVSAATQPLGWR